MKLGHLSAKIISARRFSAGVDCAGVKEGLTPDGCSDWADVRESSSAWFRMVHAASAAPRTTHHGRSVPVRPAQTQAAAMLHTAILQVAGRATLAKG